MITYKDSNNGEKYTLLFNKASMKLGLIPIIKRELENEDYVDHYYRNTYFPEEGVWRERKCDSSEYDQNGNFYEYVLDERGRIQFDDDEKPVIDQTKTVHRISSLNEYFQNIVQLGNFALEQESRTGTDPYLLRLPLDEPYFEINANTRIISVPSELRQIGVVGDKLAEIVFFKIDRYFDAIDLNTRHIYIEWQLPDGTKGFSRDVLKDTQSEQNKIIFGWMIDNTITKVPGNITFAVRFVEWTDSKDSESGSATLDYSFSTLPATISISESLNYDLLEDNEEFAYITKNTNDQIHTYLFHLEASDSDANSEAFNYGDSSIPVFVRDLTTGGQEIQDINLENDGNGNYSLKLIVEAIPSGQDGGNISYMFGRSEVANGEIGAIDGGTRIDFIKVDALVDDGRYYYAPVHGVMEMLDYVQAAELRNEDINADIRERVAYTVINRPGYYIAKAHNVAMGKRATSAYSKIAHVPAAEAPSVQSLVENPEDAFARFVINEKHYERAISAEHKIDHFTDVVFNQVGDTGSSEKPITISASAVGNGLKYQWYRSDSPDMNDENAIAIENATEATYTLQSPGYYSVKVTNTLNNSTAVTGFDKAGIYRVTNMPSQALIDDDSWANFENNLKTGTNTSLKILKPEESDEVSYEWYYITDEVNDYDDLLNSSNFDADVSGTLNFGSNNFAEIDFKPKYAGKYFFVLKNELNGAITITHGAEKYGIIEVEQDLNPTENSENNG